MSVIETGKILTSYQFAKYRMRALYNELKCHYDKKYINDIACLPPDINAIINEYNYVPIKYNYMANSISIPSTPWVCIYEYIVHIVVYREPAGDGFGNRSNLVDGRPNEFLLNM